MLEVWLFQRGRCFGAILKICLMYVGGGVRSIFVVSVNCVQGARTHNFGQNLGMGGKPKVANLSLKGLRYILKLGLTGF